MWRWLSLKLGLRLPRAVIDTNVFVRATIKPDGPTAPAITKWRKQQYELLYSTETLQELAEVLFRPRLINKYGLRPSELQSFIKLVTRQGIQVEPTFTVSICRDKDDNKFLALAAAGQADYIVSADEDLLVLKEFQGVEIITPWQFLKRLS